MSSCTLLSIYLVCDFYVAPVSTFTQRLGMNWLLFFTSAIFSFALIWTAYELLHFALDPDRMLLLCSASLYIHTTFRYELASLFYFCYLQFRADLDGL